MYPILNQYLDIRIKSLATKTLFVNINIRILLAKSIILTHEQKFQCILFLPHTLLMTSSSAAYQRHVKADTFFFFFTFSKACQRKDPFMVCIFLGYNLISPWPPCCTQPAVTLFVLFNCSNFFTLPTLGLSSSPQKLHVPSKNDVQTDLLSLLFAVLCERGVEADSKKLNTSSAFAGNFNPFSIYL